MNLAQADVPSSVALATTVGVALWLIAAVLIGRLIRNSRRGATGHPVAWDRNGDAWDRNPNGTYRLRGENSDGHLQAMDLDHIEQSFGPITFEPPAEQDPTT
jgi:hypothetical protein